MQIFLHNGQEQFGPYSDSQIKEWITSGNINETFFYFIEGCTTNWTPIAGSFLFPANVKTVQQSQHGHAEDEESMKLLQVKNLGVYLIEPVTPTEIDDILEHGAPSEDQISEYDEVRSTFLELGIEPKLSGQEEPLNHSSDSIQYYIDELEEARDVLSQWEDDIAGAMIFDDDFEYEFDRLVTDTEERLIRKSILQKALMEGDLEAEQVVKIVRKVCKGIKIRKSSYA